MANGDSETHRHFILEGFTDTEPYRSRGGGGGRIVPPRNREEHAAALSAQLDDVRAAAQEAASDTEDPEHGLGIQVEFQSFPDIDLAFESLSRENQGIELRNVRHRDDITYATVYVPTGKLQHFEGLIRDYLDRRSLKARRCYSDCSHGLGAAKPWLVTCQGVPGMPIGPNREKRPADVVANALLLARIATGKAEEIAVRTAKTPWHLGEVEERRSE